MYEFVGKEAPFLILAALALVDGSKYLINILKLETYYYQELHGLVNIKSSNRDIYR